MAKVFLVLSIVISLCAAGLGIVTKGKAEAKVHELGQTQANLKRTEGTLSTTKLKLDETSEALTTSTKLNEENKTQITDLEGKLTTAKDDAKKAQEESTGKDTKIADLEEKVKKMSEAPKPGEATDNPALVAMQAEVTAAKTAQAELKLANDQLQQRQRAQEETAVALQKKIDQYEHKAQAAGLTGNVLAVNQGWNFVVVNVGDKQGVTVNSPLIVMRGGQRVATLKITAVEPRTSIADVVPGSMARGQVVQPGDRVVFAGTRAGNDAPAPAPVSTGATPPIPGSVAGQPAPGLPQQ